MSLLSSTDLEKFDRPAEFLRLTGGVAGCSGIPLVGQRWPVAQHPIAVTATLFNLLFLRLRHQVLQGFQGIAMAESGVRQEMFPVASKQAVGHVGGVQTDVTYMGFLDKIMITVSQGGRLGQWVGV